MSIRQRSTAGTQPKNEKTSSVITPESAREFLESFIAVPNNRINVWSPDKIENINYPGVFFFPSPFTIAKVYQLKPEWDFRELKKVLLDNNIMRQITPEEVARVQRSMTTRIKQYADKHANPNHKWQQLRNACDLNAAMMRRWTPNEPYLPTAFVLVER